MIARTRPTRRRWAALVAIPALALGGAACTTSAATQGGNGSITGTGSVITIPPSERDAPPTVAGETLDGQRLDVSEYRGKVVVINYWASWCGPCRGEAPALVAAHKRLGDDVPFVGLDRNGDSNANALAFKRTFGVTYPSLYDGDGSLLLAFNGAVPPTSLPSTIVLDPQGRVAALVLGATTTTTLVELVHDVEAKS